MTAFRHRGGEILYDRSPLGPGALDAMGELLAREIERAVHAHDADAAEEAMAALCDLTRAMCERADWRRAQRVH